MGDGAGGEWKPLKDKGLGEPDEAKSIFSERTHLGRGSEETEANWRGEDIGRLQGSRGAVRRRAGVEVTDGERTD